MALLTVSHIGKQGLGNFKLQDVSFLQRRYQKIAIAGETGSGKTTLLKIIAGLERADSGEVMLDKMKVDAAQYLVPGHPDIAYLSQDFDLPMHLRVDQVLSYSNNISATAGSLYDVCQISDLLNRRTDELSGGERQRIAIAKLISQAPKLLLLDEPFSNLDMVHRNVLKQVVDVICKTFKITCILVSHDPQDVLSWADKIIVLKEGKVVQKGSARKIYRRPVNLYVAGLFGTYNLIRNENARILRPIWDIKSNGKDILVRPEHLKIFVKKITKKRKAISGKVKDVKYFGSYSAIEVDLGVFCVTVTSKKHSLKAGDKVFIHCSGEDVCYLEESASADTWLHSHSLNLDQFKK